MLRRVGQDVEERPEEPKDGKRFVIETERLWLRDLQEGDDEPLVAFNRDPQARLYLLNRQGTEQQIRLWVAHAIAAVERQPRLFYVWAVILKESNGLIGFAAVAKERPTSTVAHIGWGLDPRFWGRGYMTEAMRAATRFGFDDLGITLFVTDCFAANRASIRVMEKLGMERQRDWPGHPWLLALRYGEKHPIVRYRLRR